MDAIIQISQNPWFMWSAVAGYAFTGTSLLSDAATRCSPEVRMTRISGGVIVLLEGVSLITRIVS